MLRRGPRKSRFCPCIPHVEMYTETCLETILHSQFSTLNCSQEIPKYEILATFHFWPNFPDMRDVRGTKFRNLLSKPRRLIEFRERPRSVFHREKCRTKRCDRI